MTGVSLSGAERCAFCGGRVAFRLTDMTGSLDACRDHLLDAIECSTAFEDVA